MRCTGVFVVVSGLHAVLRVVDIFKLVDDLETQSLGLTFSDCDSLLTHGVCLLTVLGAGVCMC
jgi:hypothetical protein